MASDDFVFTGKILFTLQGDMIAPRFDLATEVHIVNLTEGRVIEPTRSLLLPGPSVDELCGLILRENISILVCGGIENEQYQFLVWKKVKVFDRVIGNIHDSLRLFLTGRLEVGMVVTTPR